MNLDLRRFDVPGDTVEENAAPSKRLINADLYPFLTEKASYHIILVW